MSLRLLFVLISSASLILGTGVHFGVRFSLVLVFVFGVSLTVWGLWTRRFRSYWAGFGLMLIPLPAFFLICLLEAFGLVPSARAPLALEEMARITQQRVTKIKFHCRVHMFFSYEGVWAMECTSGDLSRIREKFDLVPVEDFETPQRQMEIARCMKEKLRLPPKAGTNIRCFSTRAFPISGWSGPDGHNMVVVYYEDSSLLLVWNKFIF